MFDELVFNHVKLCLTSLCSSTAPNDEEISGIHLVEVVPVSQIRRSASPKAPETRCERVLDPDSGLWRSHLDLHRIQHTPEHTAWTEASSTSSESGEHHPTVNSWRKISAPAGLSRSKHYPFPQKKSPRQSETARRLGLYASL